MTSPFSSDDITLLKVLQALWNRKWTVLMFVLVAMLMGGYYAFAVAVPKYSATTTLVLQPQNERVVDIESVLSGVSTDRAALNTEIEVIHSLELLKQVVNSLDLMTDPEFNTDLRPEPAFSITKLRGMIRSAIKSVVGGGKGNTPAKTAGADVSEEQRLLNEVVARLKKKIEAANLRDTYVFTITATTEGSMKSAVVANAVAAAYIQDQIDVKFHATENAVAWLSDRVSELESELHAQEEQIKEARAELGLATPEALAALNQQARDAQVRLEEGLASLDRQNSRITALETALEQENFDKLIELLESPVASRLRTQMINGDINAEALLRQQAKNAISQTQQAISRSINQVSVLESSLLRFDENVEEASKQLSTLQQLERDTQSTRTLYETFSTRLKETSVQRGLQQADGRVLSHAIPGIPVKPRRVRILIVSILLGGMAGAAFVLFRQFMQTGFLSVEELEESTGISAVGQIPLIPIQKRGELLSYLHENPNSAAVEAVRNLRTSILLKNIDEPPQVIISTSSMPGEGKTTLAISLAHNFAGLGKRVLLIEGDMRRRTFDQYFDLPETHGINSILMKQATIEEVIYQDQRTQIEVLRAEASDHSAADTVSSEAFRNMLTELRAIYDFIIIDTPPLILVPDARVYGQMADFIIMSVGWNKTPQYVVLEGLRQLRSIGLDASGLVLSQYDPKAMSRYGYSYNYANNNQYYDT